MRIRLSTLLLVGGLTLGALGAWAGPWRGGVADDDPVSVEIPEQTAAALFAALAVATSPVAVEVEEPVDRAFGLRVASTARVQLRRPDRDFRDDCSGYVSAVMTAQGIDMDGRVATIYERAVANFAVHWDVEPIAGDLVFFDDTHDRNHNGVLDDDLTHIGIVLDVEPDGTVVFSHAGLSSGRGIGRMNLHRPDDREDAEGVRLNSTLRNPRPWDPPGTVYLTGQLFAGFARVQPGIDWTVNPG